MTKRKMIIMYPIIVITTMLISIINFTYATVFLLISFILYILIFCIAIYRKKYIKNLEQRLKTDYENQIEKFNKNNVLNQETSSAFKQIISMNIAFYAFENEDYQTFLHYIEKINKKKFVYYKYFWLSIYQFKIKNKEKFFESSDLFFQSPLNIKNPSIVKDQKQLFEFLAELVNYKKDKEINPEIISKYRNYRILNKICEEILTQRDKCV